MECAVLRKFIQDNIFVPLDVLDTICGAFHMRAIEKGELLLRAGKVSNEYLFIESGMLRSFTFDPNGDEVTTWFFQPNRVAFEVSSFFLRIPSTESIQAISDCTVHAITYDQLNDLFHTIMEFREFGRKVLVKEFATFKQRALGLINLTAEERYVQLLRDNPDIFRYAHLKYIASFLGITDSSLSRIRREFSRK